MLLDPLGESPPGALLSHGSATIRFSHDDDDDDDDCDDDCDHDGDDYDGYYDDGDDVDDDSENEGDGDDE